MSEDELAEFVAKIELFSRGAHRGNVIEAGLDAWARDIVAPTLADAGGENVPFESFADAVRKVVRLLRYYADEFEGHLPEEHRHAP